MKISRSHSIIIDEIIDYISQDRPSWRRRAKSLVEQFEQLLDRYHPALDNALARVHRRPFPKPPRPLYLSIFRGTIDFPAHRLPSVRRSWSLIDLGGVYEEDRFQRGVLVPKLRRANSTNALE